MACLKAQHPHHLLHKSQKNIAQSFITEFLLSNDAFFTFSLSIHVLRHMQMERLAVDKASA
jgi:hypothetical protein